MPLPWLIGAAAVAAAAAVVKAVSDDDDDSSSTSGEEERREQEREAERQRQRKSLKTRLANLKENRLEYAHALLVRSAEGLGKPIEVVVQSESEHDTLYGGMLGQAILGGAEARPLGASRKLTFKKLESALKSKELATSEYSQAISSILRTDGTSQDYYTPQEIEVFLTNLRVFDSLSSEDKPSFVNSSAYAYLTMPTTVKAVLGGAASTQGEESFFISLSDGERKDCEKIRAASSRIERLQHLKSKIEREE